MPSRVKTTVKKHHRSWIWWALFAGPILFTAWLLFWPGSDLQAIKLNLSEERVMESRRMPERTSPTPAPVESEDGGIVDDETKEDIDWMLGHLYKLGPLAISLLALWKKKAIKGE